MIPLSLFKSANSSCVWSNSIKFLTPLSKEHPPSWFLFLTPTLVVLSIPISFYLFVKNLKINESIVNSNKSIQFTNKNINLIEHVKILWEKIGKYNNKDTNSRISSSTSGFTNNQIIFGTPILYLLSKYKHIVNKN